MGAVAWQSVLDVIYPHQCAMCDEPVIEGGGLCGSCWRETPFISGLSCDDCGAPLPGEDDSPVRCDDCLRLARPWRRGRAAMVYAGTARRLVLAMKHGDRQDLFAPAAQWLGRAGQDLLHPDAVLVPVPVHWTRLVSRRYDQAANLAGSLSRQTGIAHAPRALMRRKRTPPQDHKSAARRFADLQGAIRPHRRFGSALEGRAVVLIDDVLTSGATLAGATEAAYEAGASRVDVLVLARTTKDP